MAFYVGTSTTLGFASSPLIEVGLIRGFWFIPPAYINKPYPPRERSHQAKEPEDQEDLFCTKELD
jgi:hypothetical protein